MVNRIRYVTGENVNAKMIEEALQLDRISYEDLYQLQFDTCIEYFKKNEFIYIMTIDDSTDRVVGYINFSPVTKETFDAMSSGDVIDTTITGNNIMAYQKPGYYWGYFSSIVVHPHYREHGIATQMLLRWSDFVVNLAREKQIFFSGIVADAVSDVGEHILSKIGFSYSKSSSHESRIMTIDLFSDKILPSKFNREILNVYNEARIGGQNQ